MPHWRNKLQKHSKQKHKWPRLGQPGFEDIHAGDLSYYRSVGRTQYVWWRSIPGHGAQTQDGSERAGRYLDRPESAARNVSVPLGDGIERRLEDWPPGE